MAAADLARAGGRDATVEIIEHEPAWAARFTAERGRLAPLLGDAEIHQIGSTAVPGLAAKAVIDLMALVGDVDAPVQTLVQRGGYVFPEAFSATLRDRTGSTAVPISNLFQSAAGVWGGGVSEGLEWTVTAVIAAVTTVTGVVVSPSSSPATATVHQC